MWCTICFNLFFYPIIKSCCIFYFWFFIYCYKIFFVCFCSCFFSKYWSSLCVICSSCIYFWSNFFICSFFLFVVINYIALYNICKEYKQIILTRLTSRFCKSQYKREEWLWADWRSERKARLRSLWTACTQGWSDGSRQAPQDCVRSTLHLAFWICAMLSPAESARPVG